MTKSNKNIYQTSLYLHHYLAPKLSTVIVLYKVDGKGSTEKAFKMYPPNCFCLFLANGWMPLGPAVLLLSLLSLFPPSSLPS